MSAAQLIRISNQLDSLERLVCGASQLPGNQVEPKAYPLHDEEEDADTLEGINEVEEEEVMEKQEGEETE